MGRCDVPFGFYIADVILTDLEFYPDSKSITYASQKVAKPSICKSCDGVGYIAIDEDWRFIIINCKSSHRYPNQKPRYNKEMSGNVE